MYSDLKKKNACPLQLVITLILSYEIHADIMSGVDLYCF